MERLRIKDSLDLFGNSNRIMSLYSACEAWIRVDGKDLLISPQQGKNLEGWAQRNIETVKEITGKEVIKE